MDIGKVLQTLDNRLSKVERSPRLSHAAIDDTSVEVRDSTGSLRGLLGMQADGTTAVNVVNGPPPPKPSAPIVASVLGGVTVSWDGLFADGSVLPLDWARVEVHASILAVYDPIPATLQGTIETAQGATVVVPCDTDVYVRLVARNTSGTASTTSDTVGPLGPAAVVADDILDGIVTTVKLANDAVTAAKVATGAIEADAIAAAAVTAEKIGAAAVVAGKLADGAVLLNTLAGPLADLTSQRYADYFRDPDAWAQLSASSGGTWDIDENATGTPSGGGKLVATGDVQLASKALIPQDSETLYRVMVRVRATAQDPSGVGTVYLGVVGVAEDGVTLVNRAGANSNTTQHYACSAGGSLGTADGWKTYTGWIQGHGAVGVTPPAGPATDPRSPELTHADVRYLRPMVWLNFGKTTAAVMEVEAVTVEAIRTGVVGSTNLITGSVTAGAIATDAVTAGKIAADAVTAREVAAGSIATAELAAGAVTANEIAANAVTAGKIAASQVEAVHLVANAVEADKIAAGAVSADKIAANAVTTAKLDALAVTADKIAANAIIVGKIQAGAVDATALAADAITGKTITGGTITGTVIQTATSGQRITLNETGTHRILVYNSSGTIVGELSALGMGLVGSTGAIMRMDPNSTYPTLRMTNAAGTNEAIINVVEGTAGSADIGINSGQFTASGLDWKWRTFFGNDFAVMERVRTSSPSTNVGGRVALSASSAIVGYKNTSDSTQDNTLTFITGTAQLNGGRLEILPAAAATSALYVNAASGHTGNLLRLLLNGTDKFVVDKDGNLTVAGIGQRVTKRRTTDATKTSTTTVVADTQIASFTADANATYIVDGFLKYSGPGDFQMGWIVPSGTLGEWQGIGNGTTVIGYASGAIQSDTSGTFGYMVRTESTDIASTRTYGGIGTSVFGVQVRGLFRVGATAGTISLAWAQGTSNATATTLYTDSHLRLEKVA
ncbi:hypothetical protein ACGFNY_44350 [Streptomyces chartreusis]|uniref:hypothetical protein n=1 Tax=Streptomyces chartreusis TaxID=1969 RepID=UPI003720E8A6